MYPSNLIILSEESDGLFYKVKKNILLLYFFPLSQRCLTELKQLCALYLQGKLPLNMLTVTTPCQDIKPNTFMIEGRLMIIQLPLLHCWTPHLAKWFLSNANLTCLVQGNWLTPLLHRVRTRVSSVTGYITSKVQGSLCLALLHLSTTSCTHQLIKR